MVTFNFSGIPVKVSDEIHAAKISDLVKQESYTSAALDAAAPGLMAAIRDEIKTCSDAGCTPDFLEVKHGRVTAEMKIDRRRLKDGVKIGDR